MANRSKSWSEDIAKKLKKKVYRQEFFLNLIEEGSTLREAIMIIAKTMGNREFSELIGMAPSNTSRAVNLKNDIKTTTLEHILKKIGCELTAKVA